MKKLISLYVYDFVIVGCEMSLFEDREGGFGKPFCRRKKIWRENWVLLFEEWIKYDGSENVKVDPMGFGRICWGCLENHTTYALRLGSKIEVVSY